MFCLHLIRSKNAAYVPRMMGRVRELRGAENVDAMTGYTTTTTAQGEQQPSPNVDVIENGHGVTHWDHLLADVVEKWRGMHRLRKAKMVNARRAAGWCEWDEQLRRNSRGGYIDDSAGMHAWELDDEGRKTVRRTLRMGVTRERGGEIAEHWVDPEEWLEELRKGKATEEDVSALTDEDETMNDAGHG